MQAAATSKIRERAVRGSIRIKKVPVETEKAEARYRFWGLPTGVNMLPKFAPIVCKTMVEINSFCCPVIVRISHHQHKTEKQGKDPEVDIPYISGRGMYKECGNKG